MTVEEGRGKEEEEEVRNKVGGTEVEGDWVMVDENVKTEEESAAAVVGDATKVVATTANKDDDVITTQHSRQHQHSKR